jgi:hypothetical protein
LIEPPSLDARIVAQCAAFTLCSNKEQSFDSFLKGHDLESALTKLIVPAAEVARLRDQLDLAGLDERIIFSDLDGVASGCAVTTHSQALFLVSMRNRLDGPPLFSGSVLARVKMY